MKILNVNDLYETYREPIDFINEDNRYWGEIRQIANKIKSNKDQNPILLLSGPSGSGKTTTAQTIENMLDVEGIETHTISMDRYFLSLSKDEANRVDLESPERLDKALLEEHIDKLLKFEEIELPDFDFVNTRQIRSGEKLRRKPDEIIIFEGIHALNPSAISVDHGTSKMYISVRTRLEYGNGKIIHPKFVRLIRRMSRDMRSRGRIPTQTLAFFESVERGVDNFVSPYKVYADYSIDTFIGYEPLLYSAEILDNLKSERNLVTGREVEIVDMLIEFLSSFGGRDKSLVPSNSLIREFIGELKI